jgi:hypothetical protein
MKILGGHILRQALSVVGTQTVHYQKWLTRETNGAGYDVSTYATPVGMKGQVQPVSRTVYATLGLQFNKNYVTLYTESTIDDLERDRAGDRFSYGGTLYEVTSDTAWKKPQGYTGVMAIQVS